MPGKYMCWRCRKTFDTAEELLVHEDESHFKDEDEDEDA